MHQLAKTLLCVAIAGLLFFTAVLFDFPWLVVIGAIFDWLPLPTRWMVVPEDSGVPVNKQAVKVHLVFTLVAYAFAILWIVMMLFSLVLPFDAATIKYLFIELWWVAVIVGQFIYLPLEN